MDEQCRIMEDLQRKPLAFSSASNLTQASSRHAFIADDGAILNVEVFDAGIPTSAPILLAIHGICESSETIGIQHIVSKAKARMVKVAVLELEGHGLSSGMRGLCPDFEKMLEHVLQFVRHTVPALRGDSNAPYFITGSSFGGVLCIYAAEKISTDSDAFPSNFRGVVPICPAVGVDPNVIPSMPIIQCLRLISFIAPAAQTSFTPLEDPTHYNCPSDSQRNFSGHWLLSTSKMLLDATSRKVPKDIKEGKLTLSSVGAILLISGGKDNVVPIDTVKLFYNAVKAENSQFMIVRNAGHDLLFKASSAKKVMNALFDWIAENA